MTKGDILLIPFPFTNLLGQKSRPCLVLYVDSNGEDCIVTPISSFKTKKVHPSNIWVKASEYNGLRLVSFIKVNKIATLQKKIALGRLGRLESSYMTQVDKKLRRVLEL